MLSLCKHLHHHEIIGMISFDRILLFLSWILAINMYMLFTQFVRGHFYGPLVGTKYATDPHDVWNHVKRLLSLLTLLFESRILNLGHLFILSMSLQIVHLKHKWLDGISIFLTASKTEGNLKSGTQAPSFCKRVWYLTFSFLYLQLHRSHATYLV